MARGEDREGMDGMNIPPELQRAVEAELERRTRMTEAVNHFYQGDYVALNHVDMEVLQVSWKGANELMPIVLVSKAKRTELGVEVGDIVRVEANGKSLPAVVDRQFKTLKEGATVNRIVAHVLGLVARVEAGQTDEDGQSTVPVVPGSTVKVSSLL